MKNVERSPVAINLKARKVRNHKQANNIRPTVPSKAAAGAERRGAVRAAPARGESDRVRLEGALSALSCGEEEDLQSDAETLSGPQALSSQSPAKAWKGVAGEVQQGTPPSLKAEKSKQLPTETRAPHAPPLD